MDHATEKAQRGSVFVIKSRQLNEGLFGVGNGSFGAARTPVLPDSPDPKLVDRNITEQTKSQAADN